MPTEAVVSVLFALLYLFIVLASPLLLCLCGDKSPPANDKRTGQTQRDASKSRVSGITVVSVVAGTVVDSFVGTVVCTACSWYAS